MGHAIFGLGVRFFFKALSADRVRLIRELNGSDLKNPHLNGVVFYLVHTRMDCGLSGLFKFIYPALTTLQVQKIVCIYDLSLQSEQS